MWSPGLVGGGRRTGVSSRVTSAEPLFASLLRGPECGLRSISARHSAGRGRDWLGIGCRRPTPLATRQSLSPEGACAMGRPWGGGKRFAAAEPMSALRRSGYGPSDGPSYGRYYGPGGGDVPVHVPPPLYPPLRPEPPQPPVSWRGRGGAPAETTWPGEGAGGDAYYPSGGAWAEPSRAGGAHQVSFAVFPGNPVGKSWAEVRTIGGSLLRVYYDSGF